MSNSILPTITMPGPIVATPVESQSILPVPPPAPPRPAATARSWFRNPFTALRGAAAAYCHRRDVGEDTLALFSLVLCVVASVVLVTGHQGMGAVLALLALLVGSVAGVPPPWTSRNGPLVDGLGTLGELLILGGFFAGFARLHHGITAALAVVALGLMVWLPLVKARASDLIPETQNLWRRGDRMAVLVLGSLTGRPVAALAAIAVVAALDGWLHLLRLDMPPVAGEPSAPPWTRRFVAEDGSLSPRLRWLSLAATVALLFVLPTNELWRF